MVVMWGGRGGEGGGGVKVRSLKVGSVKIIFRLQLICQLTLKSVFFFVLFGELVSDGKSC